MLDEEKVVTYVVTESSSKFGAAGYLTVTVKLAGGSALNTIAISDLKD